MKPGGVNKVGRIGQEADRVLSPSATEPVVSAHSGNAPLRCAWCRKPQRIAFYQGKLKARCKCHSDHRTPIEKRRDAVLDKYGDDPAAYTPKVLARLAKGGLFDIATAFCPAGKMSMAETKAREAAALRGDGA